MSNWSLVNRRTLQFVVTLGRSRNIRHVHNLNDQTCPACEMLGALTLACLRVILLPGKTRLFPLLEDVLNDILAQFGVDLGCLRSVRTWGNCNILEDIIVAISNIFLLALCCFSGYFGDSRIDSSQLNSSC